ncbi:MAG: alpha-ribazole phosphatase [Candidatus Abyssubacteria bacterium]
MLVYLIRHGETEWNVEKRCQGFSDSELNATGRRQAEAVARQLSKVKLSAIYSSTLKRAYDTAFAIARYHSVQVEALDGLRELNQGEFEGLTLSELVERHADFLEKWFREPADVRLPGGETLREMQERAWAALERIIEANSNGNVAVVSHSLCNLSLLCRILNLDLTDFRRLHLDVAGMSIIEFGGRWPHPVVLRLNDTSHLE